MEGNKDTTEDKANVSQVLRQSVVKMIHNVEVNDSGDMIVCKTDDIVDGSSENIQRLNVNNKIIQYNYGYKNWPNMPMLLKLVIDHTNNKAIMAKLKYDGEYDNPTFYNIVSIDNKQVKTLLNYNDVVDERIKRIITESNDIDAWIHGRRLVVCYKYEHDNSKYHDLVLVIDTRVGGILQHYDTDDIVDCEYGSEVLMYHGG